MHTITNSHNIVVDEKLTVGKKAIWYERPCSLVYLLTWFGDVRKCINYRAPFVKRWSMCNAHLQNNLWSSIAGRLLCLILWHESVVVCIAFQYLDARKREWFRDCTLACWFADTTMMSTFPSCSLSNEYHFFLAWQSLWSLMLPFLNALSHLWYC